jgi:hypothetical protein
MKSDSGSIPARPNWRRVEDVFTARSFQSPGHLTVREAISESVPEPQHCVPAAASACRLRLAAPKRLQSRKQREGLRRGRRSGVDQAMNEPATNRSVDGYSGLVLTASGACAQPLHKRQPEMSSLASASHAEGLISACQSGTDERRAQTFLPRLTPLRLAMWSESIGR